MTIAIIAIIVALYIGSMEPAQREKKKKNLTKFVSDARQALHAATAPNQADVESTDTDIVEDINPNTDIENASYQDFQMTGQGYNPQQAQNAQQPQTPPNQYYPPQQR